MQPPRVFLAASLAATLLGAQTVVLPNGFAAVEGSSSTAYPWGRGAAAIRSQYGYDSTNLTAQGINYPIAITRVKWRANGGAVTVGGTYSNVTIALSTATVDHLALSATFASNQAGDLTTVYTGAVVAANGAGTTPNNYYVDVPFTTPFVYNPGGGDLLFDISSPAASFTGTTPAALDVEFTAAALCSRVYNLTSNVALTGTFQANVGPVIEMSYTPAAGYAYTVQSGTGCMKNPPDPDLTSFYEDFPPVGTFDLSNTSLSMTPAGTGYLVTNTAAGSYVAPTSVGLALTDDSLSAARNLGFTLNYPGGSTSQVRVCSNGYIWLNGTATIADFTPTAAELLSGGPRVCPMWMDCLPDGATNLNNVYYETDVVNNLVRITWLNVPEYNAGVPFGANTLQVIIYATGTIEILYQTCTNAIAPHNMIVGFSPGANNANPGSRDISATVPFSTSAASIPLRQGADRPVLGTTINLNVSSIPSGSLVGVELIGLGIPGIDLTGAGLIGCSLYVTPILIVLPFSTASSTAAVPLSLPNDPSLVGGSVAVQAVVVAPFLNPFGAITSNQASLVFGNL